MGNGYFSVPNGVPASKPVRLYLFTGLQNVDWIPIVDPQPQGFDIIQPVLQTPTDYGIGDWSVKSWWVTLHAGAVASSEVILKSGGQVYGVMEGAAPPRTSSTVSTWQVARTRPSRTPMRRASRRSRGLTIRSSATAATRAPTSPARSQCTSQSCC